MEKKSTVMFNLREQPNKPSFLSISSNRRRKGSSIEQDALRLQGTKFIRSTSAQLKVAGACFILSLACGMSMGHTTVLLRDLKSDHSRIYTDAGTGTWISWVQTIAVPIGCLLGGISMDHWGRKGSIIAYSGFFVFGWWIITGAQNHAMIFIGRILNGICTGSVMTLVMIVTAEFSDHRARGPLMSASHVFLILGCVLVYALGLVMDWRKTAGIAGLFPLTAGIAFYFMPESPTWLVRKYRMIEARRTLLWVHGQDREHQANIEHEDMVHRRRSDEVESFRRFAGYSTGTLFSSAIHKYWKTITETHILKPFLISLIFNTIQIFFGVFVFVEYAVFIFDQKEDRKCIDSHKILLFSKVLRLPGLIANMILLHWIRRRSISITSGIASSVFSLIIGILVYLSGPAPSETERWLILVLILLYITSDSWGFYILPLISTAELLPGSARGVLSGFIYATNGIITCIALLVNDEIYSAVNTHHLFWIFCIFCLICTGFVYFFLPETKERSLEAIEDMFRVAHIVWIVKKFKKFHGTDVEMKLNEIT